MTVRDYSRYLTPETLAEEEAAWERQGDQPMHAALVTAALPHPAATVVEWGCGTGRVAAKLPAEVIYHGVDANPLCLALARERRPSGIFHPCDLRGAAGLVPDADLICAFAVFKHFAWEEWPWLRLQFLSVAPRAMSVAAVYAPIHQSSSIRRPKPARMQTLLICVRRSRLAQAFRRFL